MNPTATNAKGTNTHSYPAYDYAIGIGTGLVACKDGTIVDMPGVPTRQLIGYMQNGQAWPNAGGGSPNSGNVINIDHGNGEITSYLHDSPFDVNAFRGRKVKQGEVFHKSGHNGWSTGPHLHFEVWKNGVRIDPGPWLANINQGGNMQHPSGQGCQEADQLANYWHQVAEDRQKLVNPTDAEVKELTKKWIGRDPTSAEVNQFTSQKWKSFTEWLLTNKPGGSSDGTILTPGSYVVK